MSLLAQVNQPNPNGYYFALDSTPVDPTVTAPFFTATGGPGSVPAGTFASLGDAQPAGSVSFVMAKPNSASQWGIGMANVPAGANSGNDLAIYSYADNGAFLGAPLQIDRSSGLVSVGTDLAVVESVTAASVVAGAPTTVGGGDIQVDGTDGLSRVFDGVYNRPAPGAEVLLSQFGPTGAPVGPLVPYTPANSGLFTLTMEVRADTNGYVWANGTDIISGYLANVAPPFALLSDSFTTCDSLANPAAIFYPSGFPGGVYVKDIVAVINLTAGVAYQPTIAIGAAPTFNLGATGGVRFFIQPLLA